MTGALDGVSSRGVVHVLPNDELVVSAPPPPASLDTFAIEPSCVARPSSSVSSPALNLCSVRAAAPEGKYSLPSHVEAGTQTIHWYMDHRWTVPSLYTTAFVPMPTREFPGVMLDLNKKLPSQVIRNRCIIGDASLKLPFLGIDKRPGTPLDRWLEKIVERIPVRDDGTYELETVVQYIVARKHEKLSPSEAGVFPDGKRGYPYGNLPADPRVEKALWDAQLSLLHSPAVATGIQHPVVPLEEAWESGAPRLCLMVSLLVALVLERLKIPARLVNGANDNFPRPSMGHAWVELEDGRIIDLPMGLGVGTPVKGHSDFPEWKYFGQNWRYETTYFPYLAWFDANER